MAAVPTKRSTAALKALYQLHPSLKDVYVEGRHDREVLQWFLARKGKKDVAVYDIGTVDVPEDLVDAMKLNRRSNRDRVLVLAEILSKSPSAPAMKAKCVADADFDRCLGRCRNNRILEYTDYTCMEMYFFNEDFVKKFLNLALGGFPVAPSTLLRHMQRVLEKIFLIRLTNEVLNWDMTWVDFKKNVAWKEKEIAFDEAGFLERYLLANGRGGCKGEFESALTDLRAKLHSERRHNMCGHDFTYLLYLTIKKRKSHTAFGDPQTLEGALRGCLELAFVEQEPLFAGLRTL